MGEPSDRIREIRHRPAAEIAETLGLSVRQVERHAYERASLIVTTNLPFESWTEVLGSERLTGALLARLTHRVHILEANGESFRFREAKRRLKGRTQPRAPQS